MNRREFLRTGTAVGAVGLGGLGGLAARSLGARIATEPETSVNGPLRLNYNENSMGLSRAAREAIRSATAEAHRYPDELRGELKAGGNELAVVVAAAYRFDERMIVTVTLECAPEHRKALLKDFKRLLKKARI